MAKTSRGIYFVGMGCLVVALSPLTSVHAQKPAQEELQTLHVGDGLEVSLYASEPLITNPAAIDIDTQGRVWVAEIQWYRSAAKDPPADKIKVLEDTDGDGVADKSTVFAEDLLAPMSICVAGDRVFVATSPDLWVYEDRDGDLHADGPPKKLLTGFGGYNRDHGAHSLVLGPDHKWWTAHGDYGFKVTGTDGSMIESTWGAVARGELDGSQLEVVAANFRNPYELGVSSFGECFLADNDNDGNFSARFCWIMEGGDYGWFGRPPGKRGSVPESIPFSEHWHFRGHIPGNVPATVVTGFGAPAGMCFYEGDAFGSSFKNVSLLTDPGPREVRLFRHEPVGAGMRGSSQLIVSSDGDDYFRPVDICAAPDGSLFIADWYDGAVGGHAYTDPLRGRIFRLTPQAGLPPRVGKPGPYANVEDAIEGLQNPNLATQFLAREALLKDAPNATPTLAGLLKAADLNVRARALWILDRMGGEARGPVVAALTHPDAPFRALAVRILRRHGSEYADQILPLANDSSSEVRREVLLALANIEGQQAEAAILKLTETYDGQDRYLLEAINIAAGNPERKQRLFEALTTSQKLTIDQLQLYQVLNPQGASELITQQLASTTDDAQRLKLLLCLAVNPTAESFQALVDLAASPQAAEAIRKQALDLIASQLANSNANFGEDPALIAALQKLLADPTWQMAALDLIADGRVKEMGEAVLKLAGQADASDEVHRRALDVATRLRVAGTSAVLQKSLQSDDATFRELALESLVRLQDWTALQKLLMDEATPGVVKAQITTQMMASSTGAIVLLRWLEKGEMSPALTQRIIAVAANHPDSNVRLLYERYIPEKERPKRLGEAIHAEQILALTGNPSRGLEIFQSPAAQCRNCHLINGFGQDFGPDLTQIGKKYGREALLDTILNPSKAIAPEFVPYVLETDEGMAHNGFLLENNEREVVIKDIKGNLIHVPKESVVTLEAQKKSMMPELVLRDVSAQDAADLLAYLMSLKEPLPKKGLRAQSP